MLKVHSPWNHGHNGLVVDIECQISNGLPGVSIVGYGNRSIDEAKERLRSAFASSKLTLPRKRITLNLAPADIPKESTSFDLAMAVAILAADKQIKHLPSDSDGFIGEIGLDGTIRLVRGVIGKILAGKTAGITTFYLPPGNIAQASLITGITLYPVESLEQLYKHLNLDMADTDTSGPIAVVDTSALDSPVPATGDEPEISLGDIVGQTRAKRALQIAAAGGHNILLNGPPGTGKSMLAKSLPSILPSLTHDEMVEVTHLHSLASDDYGSIITRRPFRSPHHSASHVAIVGGGTQLRPGEITLSHRGILFFDELPEFNRSTIEALRQPLEDKVIAIARAKQSAVFPADFILVTTSNPCPCGYYGTRKTCRCLPHEIQRYRRKLSGPILDRIDLYIEVEEVDHANLLKTSSSSESVTAQARQSVIEARQIQANRYKSAKKTRLNGGMTNRDIQARANLTEPAKLLLDQAATKLDISARNYMRTIKVARTIADIEGQAEILPAHVSEALQYRSHNYNSSSD